MHMIFILTAISLHDKLFLYNDVFYLEFAVVHFIILLSLILEFYWSFLLLIMIKILIKNLSEFKIVLPL